ncbi:MAG: phosphopentomutase [Desulfuromonas sp.]|nr:phosphopentomutase [Desulfuromonas sp.]
MSVPCKPSPRRPGRAVWIVLDGVGLGALPDAAVYGDEDAATLPHVAAACGGLFLPSLQRLGLGHLADIAGVPPVPVPCGAFGRMREQAAGKDSISGHWEMAGVTLTEPFATFPQGFPAELIERFAEIAGCPPIGNVGTSGTSILRFYGAEHLRTGRPIVYTSVDSVFQIAAHEAVLPPEELYRLCRKVRALVDDYRIGRVIARPFTGDVDTGLRRTPGRKDFPLPPPRPTLLDCLTAAGIPVWAVGKLADLFAGRGIARQLPTRDNDEGMARILDALEGFGGFGLLAVNLIDFDMIYGHRQDAVGFGRALERFDAWLPQLQAALAEDDLLLISADHGCDPLTPGTDHTREYVPILAWRPELNEPRPLGERTTFADLGATIAEYFGVTLKEGKSFLEEIG